MSYQRALEDLRQQTVAPPSFTDVERRRRWAADRAVPRGRRRVALVATYLSVVAYLVLTVRPVIHALPSTGAGFVEMWRGSLATLLPAGLLLWAARLARRDAVGPQMLSRAIWWSNLVVGVLIATAFLSRFDRTVGVWIAALCATSIIAAGVRGLDGRDEDEFRPTRFRGLLLVALVMAFADAQTLLFSGIMQLRLGMEGWNLLDTIVYAGPTWIACGVMGLAVWGLYRLRTWALLLNLVANFVIAYAALDGFLGLSLVVGAALASTAAVQAFLPYPILAAALGDRKAGQPVLGRFAAPLVMVAVALVASLSIIGRGGGSAGWLTGPGRAFLRGITAERQFERRDLRDRDFSGAPIARRSFAESDLEGVDFSDAHGSGVSFRGANLRGANLQRAELDKADMWRATLAQADLRDAAMPFCRGSSSDWSGVDARGANLGGCRLARATLVGADLRGADLRYAVLPLGDAEKIEGVRWEGAVCPDGLRATGEAGCVAHAGDVLGLHDQRSRYEGAFERIGEPRPGPDCSSFQIPPALTKVVLSKSLHFAKHVFFRQSDTRFVAGFMGREFVLDWEWDAQGEPMLMLYDDVCGDSRWRRVR